MGFETEFNYVLRLEKEKIPPLETLTLGSQHEFYKDGKRLFDDENLILLQDKGLNLYAIIKIKEQTRHPETNSHKPFVTGTYIVKGHLTGEEKSALKSYYQKLEKIISKEF